jgi:hypothetical protein
MGWQHRKTQTARITEIALDGLLRILGLRASGISISQVTTMLVDHPSTTTRTHRTLAIELSFAKLNRGAFPKSSTPIKPL